MIFIFINIEMSDKEIRVDLNKVKADVNDDEELDEAALKKKKIEERTKYLTDTYVKKKKPVIEDRKIIPIINGVPVRKSFDSDDENENDETNGKSSYGQVQDKLVKDLTADERTIILKNYSDGIKNDNYEVRMLKNGNPSITRKRGGKPKNINDEIVKEASKVSGRVGNMTTEQFMIQNFIDLENKFTKMKSKQKRLKKKYKKLKGDIYVDDEDVGESIEIKAEDKKLDDAGVKNEVQHEIQDDMQVNVVDQVQNNEQSSVKQPVYYQNYGRKMTLRERLLLQRGLI